MKNVIKHLWLVTTLIIAASLLLMMSDRGQRTGGAPPTARSYPAIAVMQLVSTTVLDAHVAGVLDRLSEKGYRAADGTNIRLYNAHGDFGNANAMAREIVSSPYEMIVTSSTVSLQVVAKANSSTKKLHVFGAVTDPYGTGVGITGAAAQQHPPYMAGIGSFQPVKSAIRLAREMNPDLRRLGVVWNSAEQCSEACLKQARSITDELDIELVEAIAGNTSEVSEALRSVLMQNVDALWVGGDTVASAAIGLIVHLAEQAGVPVFTNDPMDVKKGALFGLGGDYFTIGQLTADLAIAILEGQDPATVRIENVVPEQLALNEEVLARHAHWQLSPSVKALLAKQATAATATMPADGVEAEGPSVDFAALKKAGLTASAELLLRAQRFVNLHDKNNAAARIAVVNLVENLSLQQAITGVEAGLAEMGLRDGHDFILKKYCAQGDMTQLGQILDQVAQLKPDALITVSTPALIAAVKRNFEFPLIFTVASDPAKIGLFHNGRPANLCGIHDDPPVAEVLAMAKKYAPGLTAVGIVYDAGQINAVLSVEKLRRAGNEQRITVLEATASTVSELLPAVQSVIQRGAGALIVSADNLAGTGFSVLHKAAKAAGIAIYATDTDLVELGADGAIGDNYHDWGRQSGRLAARVIAGLPPALLPIQPTQVHRRIEPATAQATTAGKPFQLRMVLYSETEFAERCRDGIIDGLSHGGLRAGRDYQLRSYNAQGDMSTLASIMSTIRADHVDLLLAVSTPTLQAALRQAGAETNIVFCGVGDAVRAGAGQSETDHLPNVTGITTRSPFNGMARLIKDTLPTTHRVGTLFTPGEINSVLYKDWFEQALAEVGLELVAIPVSSSADIAQAAIELCRQPIQVVAQVVDNLTRPGFALIARKAAERELPVFVFDSAQMAEGGTLCLGRDYYDSGREAAAKALRILRGEHPQTIPFNNTRSEKLLLNPLLAARYNLHISEQLKSQATRYDPAQ